MEALSEEIWDIVIAGTSLPQSLLALSLSRSGKKILHVDRNDYYGGHDAGFSLQDAEKWAEQLKTNGSKVFTSPSFANHSDEVHRVTNKLLGAPRSYTLSLNPQIIYAQSLFLPALVSSQIHTQLEFLAVGSWWILRDGTLHKIPSTREDVFTDDTLSMRDKRSLMRFLRYLLQPEDLQQQEEAPPEPQTLRQALGQRFNIPESLYTPIQALALSYETAHDIDFHSAVQRIRQHVRSIGSFGPGFGAVIAKYGGNAEIAQVACRAQAIGGGVYLLGHGVEAISDAEGVKNGKMKQVRLSDGTLIRCRCVAGSLDDLPNVESTDSNATDTEHQTVHSISVVSDPLTALFPATSENGPVPAVAIVLAETTDLAGAAPIYLQIHSGDTGECPVGQCIVYASVKREDESSADRLRSALDGLLRSCSTESPPSVLWSLSYTSHQPRSQPELSTTACSLDGSRVITIPTRPYGIALEDQILDPVKVIWQYVLGDEAGSQDFFRFEEREQDSDTVE